MTRTLLTSTALALLAVPPAFAQTASASDELDELIVIGALDPIPLEDVTSSATIIGRDEIAARGDAFISDILRGSAGIAVSQSGGFGGLTQVRLRGSEANQTVVLIDGVEASSPFTGEFEFANLQTANVERIEILRGEQSALWGSDAIGGVINIVTRPGGGAPSYSAAVEAGSFNTVRGSARIAGPVGKGRASLSASAFDSDGIDVSGRGGEKDGFENLTLNGSFAYPLLGKAARLILTGRYQDAEAQSDPDIDFDGALDNADRLRATEEVFGRAALKGDLDGGFFYEGSAGLTLVDAENYADGAFDNASIGRRWDFEGKAGWRGRALNADHRLVALVESETEMFKNDGGIPGAGENQKQEITNDAVALDYGFSAGPALLNASIRRDFNDRFDNVTTWRVGAGWRFAAIDGKARASVGEGVTNPGVFELFGFFPGSFVGNPDLQPENSTGWEIGWDQRVDPLNLDLSATYFESTLENEIYTAFNPDFTSTALNRQTESERNGVELEASWRPLETLFIDGALTLLESDENGAEEIRRPETTGSLTAGWRPAARWRIGASADYVGDQLDTDFSIGQTITLDAYTLVGAVVGYEFADGWEATLRGENLLDEDYVDVIGFETQGAAVFAGLSWKG